jgi:Zn-dependent protease with chaperone function
MTRAALRGDKRMREVFERCKTAPDLRNLPDRWRRLGQACAVLVHLATVALIAGAVFVALSTVWIVLKVLLVLLLVGFAFEVRPRLGRPAKGIEVKREQAPALWSVVTELCAMVGARPPHTLFVDGRFNASYGMVGLKRSRRLTLGYPLWNVLGPEERIAVLAHELAHDVNRDLRHSLLVGSALLSLRQWLGLLSFSTRLARGRIAAGGGGLPGLLPYIEVFAALLFAPLFGLVALAGRMLHGISDRAGQRAEYLADDFSYRIAGRGGAVSSLTKLLMTKSCIQAINTASLQGQPDLWRSEREFVDSIPDYELRRRRFIAASRMLRADGTHPPTEFRIRLLEARDPKPCHVPYLARRVADSDSELTPFAGALLQEIHGSRSVGVVRGPHSDREAVVSGQVET